MERTSIPPSAFRLRQPPQHHRGIFRYLPPNHRCSDGTVSDPHSIEEIYGSKRLCSKFKTRLYYVLMCKRISRVKRLYLKSRSRLYYLGRCKKVSFTNIKSLPDELLFDILVRLAADYLHDRARLVCHRWCRIIRSHAFTTTHIQRSTYGLLVSPSSHRHRRSIYVTATNGRIQTSEFHYLRRAKIMAASNGLALKLPRINAGDEALRLHVINPATKKSFLLPLVSFRLKRRYIFPDRCALAYSSASMEYKVTLTYRVHIASPCLDIVTVGIDKSWRHVEIDHLTNRSRWILEAYPVTTEGFVHWGRDREFLTLDVETEMITLSEVPIPYQGYEYIYKYLSTGRYLSVLVGCGGFLWQVWEMKPQSGEWRKLCDDIDLEAPLRDIASEALDSLYPHGWVKYPEVIAFYRYRGKKYTCFFYNLETHEISTIDFPYNVLRDYNSLLHMNSLVWLSEE